MADQTVPLKIRGCWHLLRRGYFLKEDRSADQSRLPGPGWELSERTGRRIEIPQVSHKVVVVYPRCATSSSLKREMRCVRRKAPSNGTGLDGTQRRWTTIRQNKGLPRYRKLL